MVVRWAVAMGLGWVVAVGLGWVSGVLPWVCRCEVVGVYRDGWGGCREVGCCGQNIHHSIYTHSASDLCYILILLLSHVSISLTYTYMHAPIFAHLNTEHTHEHNSLHCLTLFTRFIQNPRAVGAMACG